MLPFTAPTTTKMCTLGIDAIRRRFQKGRSRAFVILTLLPGSLNTYRIPGNGIGNEDSPTIRGFSYGLPPGSGPGDLNTFKKWLWFSSSHGAKNTPLNL